MNISYLFLAEGFEEIEALTVVDMMRRAGMEIRTVAITGEKSVTGAHGIPVTADLTLAEAPLDEALWLILPGGLPGADNLANCAPLIEALKAHAAQERPVAAICAAPYVLGACGILKGRKATCYPGFEKRMSGATPTGNMVEIDGSVVTGKGPAAAAEFASTIIRLTYGDEAARTVRKGMLLD